MTPALDLWLNDATRHLSRDSATQVRSEIREHYESGREAALSTGVTEDQADQAALTALGSPKTANCQYRKVLLTSAEARLLREGNWEARAICSRPILKSLLFGMPALAFLASRAFLRAGDADIARGLLAVSIGMALFCIAPFLPVYTPSRSRIYRYVKWVVLAAMPTLAFGHDALKFSWLLIACLWPVFWVEWTRFSIRRKLPVAEWPRHLYL